MEYQNPQCRIVDLESYMLHIFISLQVSNYLKILSLRKRPFYLLPGIPITAGDGWKSVAIEQKLMEKRKKLILVKNRGKEQKVKRKVCTLKTLSFQCSLCSPNPLVLKNITCSCVFHMHRLWKRYVSKNFLKSISIS